MHSQTASTVPLAENVAISTETSQKLHGLLSIGLAASVGGAFASGYLIYKNFSATNRAPAAKRSIWLFSVIGLIALFSTWNTPPDVLSFMLSVGVPQIAVVVLIAWNLQANLFASHKAAGGAFRSVWFAFVPGVIANVTIKGLFYGISVAISG